MATDLENLVVSLSADIKSYERGLAKATGVTTAQLRKIESEAATRMGRVEKSFARVGSALAGFGKGLAIGAVFAAVAGIEQLVAGSISSAAAIGDLSDKLGITTEKLQELQFGAVQANMDFGELEKNLLKFSKSLGEARNGSGDLLKTLEANGFDQARIKALSYSDALNVVADLIKNAATEQDAMVIATQAFGRAGDDMLEFLRGGSEGLQKFATDAQNAGTIIEESLVRSAQRFDDAWAAALLNVKSGIANMVLGALPYLEALESKFNAAAQAVGVAIGTIDPNKNANAFDPNVFNTGKFLSSKTDRQPVTKMFDPDAAAAADSKRKASTKALVDQKKAVEGVIEALKFEGAQLTRSDLQQEINTKLRQAGVTATSEQGKAIAALVTKNFELARSQEGAVKGGEAFIEAQEEITSAMMDLAQQSFDAFESIVIGGEKASDVIKDLAMNLLKAAVQASLFGSGPFASIFGTGKSGGIFGSLFGKRASGGHVNAGQPYMVGERGREIMVPSQSGNIMPKISGGAARVSVNVMNFGNDNVDVRQRSSASGPSLDVIIGQKINNHIGSGQADGALAGRHGLLPQKARR